MPELIDGLLTRVQASGGTVQIDALPPPTSTNNLKAWAESEAYEPLTIERDSNGNTTSATVRWPDGSSGALTTVIDPTLRTVDGYSITHAASSQRVVQGSVTRDALGNVTNKPALTVEVI